MYECFGTFVVYIYVCIWLTFGNQLDSRFSYGILLIYVEKYGNLVLHRQNITVELNKLLTCTIKLNIPTQNSFQ